MWDFTTVKSGGVVTVRFAVLLGRPAVVVCVVVTPEVVFGCTPIALLLTEKITVQLPFAGIVIVLKVKFLMLGGILGIVCAHVPVTAPPAAFILTKTSVNVAFVKEKAFGFVKVNVTVEVPPC